MKKYDVSIPSHSHNYQYSHNYHTVTTIDRHNIIQSQLCTMHNYYTVSDYAESQLSHITTITQSQLSHSHTCGDNYAHSLTYSLTHSLAHSPTHLFTHSLTHSLIHSLIFFLFSLLQFEQSSFPNPQ